MEKGLVYYGGDEEGFLGEQGDEVATRRWLRELAYFGNLSSWIWRMLIAWTRRIGNWSNAFSCEGLAQICRIFSVGYGVLVKIQQSSNIFVLAPNCAPFSLSSQNTPELLHLSTLSN
ncbi:hypothetical protein Tco_0139901 [Tanacetum coccineum]